MRSALRQQFLPSMLFLIAGIALALARLFATRTPTLVVFFIAGRRYMEFSWLGVGVLVCFLYAILYWLIVKFLRVRIPLGLSLLHLLVTLSAVIGLAQVHYIGVRNEQSPTSYNPTSFNATLTFLGVHAFTLLLVGGLLFLAIVLLSLFKPKSPPEFSAMNGHVEALEKELSRLSELLHKYGHGGQAIVVDRIRATVGTPTPDYKRLTGIDMWGGSGAVWEVRLTPSGKGNEDERAFLQTIIQLAATMDSLKIGTERSRFIARTFQGWLEKGII